ncbi:MAG: hypothetical protein WBL80_08765 [Erysipelotrichaceae bacterium]
MRKIRFVRLSGMISILILFFVYLVLRSTSGIDVLTLQRYTMLIGCAIALAFMGTIYFLDKESRRSTLISIALILVLAVIALFNR